MVDVAPDAARAFRKLGQEQSGGRPGPGERLSRAPEFLPMSDAAVRAVAGANSRHAALIEDGEIEVPGKSTRTVHLVPAAGTYKLTCTHTLHAAFGMKGTIRVD